MIGELTISECYPSIKPNFESIQKIFGDSDLSRLKTKALELPQICPDFFV